MAVFHVCYYTLLQWLENDSLGYLAEWDEMAQSRENFTAAEKKMTTLSKDTLAYDRSCLQLYTTLPL